MNFFYINSMIDIVLSRLRRLRKLTKISIVRNLSSEIKQVIIQKNIIEETIKKKNKTLTKNQKMILDKKIKKIALKIKKMVFEV